VQALFTLTLVNDHTFLVLLVDLFVYLLFIACQDHFHVTSSSDDSDSQPQILLEMSKVLRSYGLDFEWTTQMPHRYGIKHPLVASDERSLNKLTSAKRKLDRDSLAAQSEEKQRLEAEEQEQRARQVLLNRDIKQRAQQARQAKRNDKDTIKELTQRIRELQTHNEKLIGKLQRAHEQTTRHELAAFEAAKHKEEIATREAQLRLDETTLAADRARLKKDISNYEEENRQTNETLRSSGQERFV